MPKREVHLKYAFPWILKTNCGLYKGLRAVLGSYRQESWTWAALACVTTLSLAEIHYGVGSRAKLLNCSIPMRLGPGRVLCWRDLLVDPD